MQKQEKIHKKTMLNQHFYTFRY